MNSLGWRIFFGGAALVGLAVRANASEGSSSETGVIIEALYGTASVKSDELNDARDHFKFNSTTPSEGTFNKMGVMAFGLGYKFYDWLAILARYEQSSQKLPETDIAGATYTAADSFQYDSAYLLVDFPYEFAGGFVVSFRLGLGYALKYEFHQKIGGSGNEDLVWQAHPLGYKYGVTFGYKFTSYFALFAEGLMESVHAELKTTRAYPNLDINGVPIESDQTYDNLYGRRHAADVSMSGLRAGLGIRLTF